MDKNYCVLRGYIGNTPELKGDGNNILSFSLATSEAWKNKESNNYDKKTTWHNIVCFNSKQFDFIQKHVAKGSYVEIEGKINNYKYVDSKGNDAYGTNIILNKIDPFIIPKNQNQNQNQSNNIDTNQSSPITNNPVDSSNSVNKNDEILLEDLDDEIPF